MFTFIYWWGWAYLFGVFAFLFSKEGDYKIVIRLQFMGALAGAVARVLCFVPIIILGGQREGEQRVALEAGFIGEGSSQRKFSLQFFSLLLLFIIFDLEILLVVPLVVAPERKGFHFLLLFFIAATL